MKHRITNCPACGAPAEFKTASTLVTICEFCHSAIGRTDRNVEDLGKVSEIGNPASGLHRGMTGKWKGKSFTIVGRVRYRHSAGGSWDEWYLAFTGGERWGWLSEAQGEFGLTERRRLSKGSRLPPFDSLDVGQRVTLKGVELAVREKGIAIAESAEGNMPWAFQPNAEHHFIDLYGDDGAVATYDYGDGTDSATHEAYLGQRVSLQEIGIDTSSLDQNAGVETVDATQCNCPECGGPLQLRAPDETLRIGCPNCTALLDADKGKLKVFQSLYQQKIKPEIPLGTEGKIGDHTFTVIGFMRRFVKYQGRRYPWTEHLLYNRTEGFRWLVCNEGHWSIVENVKSPPRLGGDSADYEGKTFRVYDRGVAYVEYVIGEFYWRVRVGDRVRTADYIAPPQMLSYETSGHGKGEETTISIGHYISPGEIETTFGVKDLRRPWGVGVIQPSPSPGGSFYAMWFGFLAYLIFVSVFIGGSRGDGWLLIYALIGISLVPAGTLFYLYNFEVNRWSESDYSPYASSED
ncbi:MAG: DUF4178 domain-containing protein [Planctomycetota bacterium]